MLAALILTGTVAPRQADGQVFNYLAAPVDVSSGSTGWSDVDVSAWVPAGATGVILQDVNTSGDRYVYGVRENGSSDTWMLTEQSSRHESLGFHMVGVDANRVFELYNGHSALTTYLLGYTMDGVTFLTNAIDKSIGATGTWTDVDISADTGADTAIGAVFYVMDTTRDDYAVGLRMKGSSDELYTGKDKGDCDAALIGLDANEVCQMKIESTAVDLYLVGYVTSGAVFFTNAVDKATATTGSYVDVDITGDIGSDDANGAILSLHGDGAEYFGVRRNGASYDFYERLIDQKWPIVAIDADDIFEQKISATTHDLYLTGYTLAGGPAPPTPPTISSAANQSFFVGEAATAISQITVTDTDGVITAADDIRIRIPAGFGMIWDYPDTTAVIGGAASSKASTTVSYEDTNATLVLNVTSDFAAGDVITVSGLSFASFSALSSADNLEIEVYNDGEVSATDDKTVTITGPTYRSIGTAAGTIYSTGNASITTGTNVVTFAGGATLPTNIGQGDKLFLPATAGAATFNYLATPVEIGPSSASTWEDVNVSAWVPAGATGVMIQYVATASNMELGVRKNGSTDTWMVAHSTAYADTTGFLMTGVDAGRVLEVFEEDTAIKTYLIGYTMEGVTFFTNAIDKSLSTTGSYQDIDISGDTGAETAIGAILTVQNTDTSNAYALRKNGSTDDHYDELKNSRTTSCLIGVDAGEICEMKIASTVIDAYLTGYVTSGAVFFTNSVNKSTGTTGSYVDVDITADLGGDDANGAILQVFSDGGSSLDFGVRNNGASYDYYGPTKNEWAYVAIDAGNIFEQKIETTDKDLFLIGYTLATTPPYFILSRDSDTQVTLQADAGSTLSNQTYTIERAYNTMQAWEDDREGDLVTEGRREVGVCYNDGPFTDRLVISGSTTDAAHYMKLTVADGQRHNGLKNTGAMIDAEGGWTNQNAIDVEDDYTWIDGLEIKAIQDSGSGIFFDDSPSADNGLVSNIFVHSFWQANNAGVEIGAQNVTVRNSFFTGGTSDGILLLTNSTASIENCTIYGFAGSGNGISDQAGTTVSVKNTISVNHLSGSDFKFWSGVSYFGNNMYSTVTGFDPASHDGGNQLPPYDLRYLFVDASADDFHVRTSGHRAGNTGLTLSTGFSDDIDGETRAGAWDMGADEAVTGTEPLTPKVLAWQEIEP
ncbi:MAG: right-handed parallel beta-helix repeat-containing protein [Planctomycetota bacterium]